MRDRATLTIGLCAASLLAASSTASAQSSDFFSFSMFGEAPAAAPSTGDATAWAAQDPAEAAAWAATLTIEPELTSPPRELRIPKPTLAARPDLKPGQMPPVTSGKQHALSGIASYYWQDQMTASGERFNKHDLTAAHRSLPFGTRVRVFCQKTGKDVVVRINDRGPFKPGRIIDLSQAAAEKIGMTGRGLTTVQLEVVRN